MTAHSLKVWPEYWCEIVSGQKTFEIRVNDRDFKTGDSVTLCEWNPVTKEYTGEKKTFTIGYVLIGEFSLPRDMCVFSLLVEERVQP